MPTTCDALLVVSFGGPERPDDVLPFLENVLRGRNVPRERMLEVAEHYQHFGGASPLNSQNRALIAALEVELATQGLQLPIYFGNRNWSPFLADTLREMAAAGVQRALAFVTSAFSSYSGCRQYREDIVRAQVEVGATAPAVAKLRVFFNHPGFILPQVEMLAASLAKVPAERRLQTPVLFTAHSIPRAMADNCRYAEQLREASRLVAEGASHPRWELVYQSRSGPPQQPWLEPDVCARIAELQGKGDLSDVIVHPLGFLSDHMEVLYDLDTEAKALCDRLGVSFHRVPTIGTHPRFVKMIRELIEERFTEHPTRLSLGTLGPSHDVCPEDCCLYTPAKAR